MNTCFELNSLVHILCYCNTFQANVFFLYPLIKKENQQFPVVLRRYRKGATVWNGLSKIYQRKPQPAITCSKLRIKTLMYILSIFHTLFQCFYCWFGLGKCRMGNCLHVFYRIAILEASNIFLEKSGWRVFYKWSCKLLENF